MSYITPTTQIYQELQNSGGTLTSTPDLGGLVVGPCYNVVQYVAGSTAAYNLTSVGAITDNSQTTTFNLPSTKPGQTVDPTTIQVWFSGASIQTIAPESVTGTAGDNTVTLAASPTTDFSALTSAGTPVIAKGDTVKFAWTTPSAGTFQSTVLSVVDATNITIADILPSGFGSDSTIEVLQAHNDIQAQSTDIDTTNATSAGTVDVKPTPTTSYGTLETASVYIGYTALRTDLAGEIISVTSDTDIEGKLGVISDSNPLALAASIALANTTTNVYAAAVSTDDLVGHTDALHMLEGSTSVYAFAPLTQDPAIIEAYQAHIDQMSTPQNAAWRIGFVNTAIPTLKIIGSGNKTAPYTGGTITQATGNTGYILELSTGTFLSDGVKPGDNVEITASAGSQTGTFEVQEVLSNQQLLLPTTLTADTGVAFYVDRTLSKDEQATDVAATSTQFGDRRILHVQPDTCGVSVNGVTKYLPGYYICSALVGMVAGFPVQQGFTNISLAGIEDLKNSNYYFSKAQLNTMAAAGTFLLVQATQGGAPYVRHELSTDVSTLEYQELLITKNWDWLSYYYYNKLMPFIGKWNITPEMLNVMRQTIVSSSEYLKTQKLPRIGPPLLDYSITTLAQDATNKDSTNIVMSISVVYPDNYNNMHLVI